MYSFDEVIPFLFRNIDESPEFKSELFSDKELNYSIDELCRDPLGKYQLNLKAFTSTNKLGEKRTFEARLFNLHISKNIRILDDSCEGKVYAHYETTLVDIDTKERFKLFSYYYETTYDFIGLDVMKVKVKEKKITKS